MVYLSQVYRDYGTLYTIFAGTKKNFTSIIIDANTGKAMDFTNTAIFTSGTVDIVQSDGTIIQSGIPIIFTIRTAGSSQITWIAGPFTNNQAGNWKAYLKIVNSLGVTVDQQVYNLNIYESY